MEYRKYKCSEKVDEECLHHMREVVRRKGDRMIESGTEKQYWRKKRDALRDTLDSKDTKNSKKYQFTLDMHQTGSH